MMTRVARTAPGIAGTVALVGSIAAVSSAPTGASVPALGTSTTFSPTTTTSHSTTTTTYYYGTTTSTTRPRTTTGGGGGGTPTTTPAETESTAPDDGRPCEATSTRKTKVSGKQIAFGVKIAAFADVVVKVKGTVEVDGKTVTLTPRKQRVDADLGPETITLKARASKQFLDDVVRDGTLELEVDCIRIAPEGASEGPIIPELGVPERVVEKRRTGTPYDEQLDNWTAGVRWNVVPGLQIQSEYEKQQKAGDDAGAFSLRIVRSF